MAVDLKEVVRLVDAYVVKRSERLSADKIAAKLKQEEDAFKAQLVKIAIESESKSLGGSVATVNYKREYKPVVRDWEKLYAYVREHNAFELLQRRLGEKAVEERWEDEISVPGVESFPVDNLTISGKT